MTLGASLAELDKAIREVDRALGNVHWAAVEAQPSQETGHALVHHLDAATTDLQDMATTARYAVTASHRTVAAQQDLRSARQSLIVCQRQYIEMMRRFYSDLVAFDQIDDLYALESEREGEWAQWVVGVKDALKHCSQPLQDLGEALFACWQELTEQNNGSSSVWVQAFGIGPQAVESGEKSTKS
jgi:hypothetical protein